MCIKHIKPGQIRSIPFKTHIINGLSSGQGFLICSPRQRSSFLIPVLGKKKKFFFLSLPKSKPSHSIATLDDTISVEWHYAKVTLIYRIRWKPSSQSAVSLPENWYQGRSEPKNDQQAFFKNNQGPSCHDEAAIRIGFPLGQRHSSDFSPRSNLLRTIFLHKPPTPKFL